MKSWSSKRSAEDKCLQLTWRYRNATDKTIEVLPDIRGEIRAGWPKNAGPFMMEHLYLTYSSNGKEFRLNVTKDEGKKLWCSNTGGGLKVDANEVSPNLWAKFDLLPADVKKVKVHFDDIDPFVLEVPAK